MDATQVKEYLAGLNPAEKKEFLADLRVQPESGFAKQCAQGQGVTIKFDNGEKMSGFVCSVKPGRLTIVDTAKAVQDHIDGRKRAVESREANRAAATA